MKRNILAAVLLVAIGIAGATYGPTFVTAAASLVSWGSADPVAKIKADAARQIDARLAAAREVELGKIRADLGVKEAVGAKVASAR